MEIIGEKRDTKQKGFYIVLENGKYNLIPHKEYPKNVLAFAETTRSVENVLMRIVCSNLINSDFATVGDEMDKLEDFPTICRSLELILTSPFAMETVQKFDLNGTFTESA